MTMHTKRFEVGMTLLVALSVLAPGRAQTVVPEAAQSKQCVAEECRNGDDLIFRIHSYGEAQPAEPGDGEAALQASRRVQIATAQDSRGTSSIGEEGRADRQQPAPLPHHSAYIRAHRAGSIPGTRISPSGRTALVTDPQVICFCSWESDARKAARFISDRNSACPLPGEGSAPSSETPPR